jgi:hypothetical protein
MPTTETPEADLTPELIDRVMKLSRESLGRLIGLALEHLDGPDDDPVAVKEAMRAELTRRWELIRSGAAPTYTPAEAIAYARERLRQRKPQ